MCIIWVYNLWDMGKVQNPETLGPWQVMLRKIRIHTSCWPIEEFFFNVWKSWGNGWNRFGSVVFSQKSETEHGGFTRKNNHEVQPAKISRKLGVKPWTKISPGEAAPWWSCEKLQHWWSWDTTSYFGGIKKCSGFVIYFRHKTHGFQSCWSVGRSEDQAEQRPKIDRSSLLGCGSHLIYTQINSPRKKVGMFRWLSLR